MPNNMLNMINGLFRSSRVSSVSRGHSGFPSRSNTSLGAMLGGNSYSLSDINDYDSMPIGNNIFDNRYSYNSEYGDDYGDNYGGGYGGGYGGPCQRPSGLTNALFTVFQFLNIFAFFKNAHDASKAQREAAAAPVGQNGPVAAPDGQNVVETAPLAQNNSGISVEELNSPARQFDNWAESAANNEQLGEFNFVGPEYYHDVKENGGKNAAALYKKGLMNLATGSIHLADKNNDGVLSYEEFKAKAIEDYKKAYPGQPIDDAVIEEQARAGFAAMNVNGDNVVDAQEEAAVYAAMDQDEKGELDGKISRGRFINTSTDLGTGIVPGNVKKMFDYFFPKP